MDLGDIYVITSPSGKFYIGQCVQYLCSGKKWGYRQRFKQHVRDATHPKGKDYCRLLNNAIRKYKPENMTLEKILDCKIEDLDELESYHIETYYSLSPNGYNLIVGGSNSRQSQETIERRRQSMYGKNKGNIYPRRPRKRYQDKTLPKYLRSYHDKFGKTGYRISNHPLLKDKSFVSKYKSQEEKLKLALEYLHNGRNK